MYQLSNPQRPALISARDEGQTIDVLGTDLTVKISGQDTNGAFSVLEGRTAPLDGPPLHRHSGFDEYWYIVEGEYRFEIDGQEILASAGATVFAPRGSSHTLQNIGSERGRTIVTAIPGGVELFFEELERAFPKGSAPDPARMVPIFEKHGMELLGPPLRARSNASGPLTVASRNPPPADPKHSPPQS